MLFNHRRVSRDRAVTDKVREMTEGKRLWIRKISEKLFESNVIIDEDMLHKAGTDDYCFVEDVSVSELLDKIDALYVFKWNRKYPSDLSFDKENFATFHLEATEEFAGRSHEKITLERWTK